MAGKQRIQLIDALRGLAVGLMVVHHFLYDLVAFCGAPEWLFSNPVFDFLHFVFAGLFIFLSGVSSNFSRSNVKRGAEGPGLRPGDHGGDGGDGDAHPLRGAASAGHLHGAYGLTRPLWERLPFWAVPALSLLGLVLTGHMVGGVPSESRWLWMLGWTYEGFVSTDYFPLLPWVFVFLLGTWAGKYIKAGGCPPGSMGRTARPWRRWAATVWSSMSSTSRYSTA